MMESHTTVANEGLGIPYQTCINPGGHCYWVGGISKVPPRGLYFLTGFGILQGGSLLVVNGVN